MSVESTASKAPSVDRILTMRLVSMLVKFFYGCYAGSPRIEALMTSGIHSLRWGQARRIAFIDLRLQYDGRLNRKDLIDFFGISVPQASSDLAEYAKIAPDNMEYDASARAYIARPGFTPVSGRATSSHYLFELYGLARELLARDESFIGYAPVTGIVATPARPLAATEIAEWVRAIRDGDVVAGRYQSMDADMPRGVRVSPHALGYDGLRWHVRAYCHTRSLFRDFAIGRFEILKTEPGSALIDATSDLGWVTEVGVRLVPHPGLTASQRLAVAKDYAMQDGVLVLRCRKAMLFYTLRHLNLESLEIQSDPARQHVIVENHQEVAQWILEDRQGLATAG